MPQNAGLWRDAVKDISTLIDASRQRPDHPFAPLLRSLHIIGLGALTYVGLLDGGLPRAGLLVGLDDDVVWERDAQGRLHILPDSVRECNGAEHALEELAYIVLVATGAVTWRAAGPGSQDVTVTPDERTGGWSVAPLAY